MRFAALSAERLASVSKALAHPARVKVVSLIAASAGEEACICDFTEPLGLSQPTESHYGIAAVSTRPA